MAERVPLERFPVIVLDMNSTFMFQEDRFGATEDFWATYVTLGGRGLDPATVDAAIRAAFAFLDARHNDPSLADAFVSLGEALAAVAPALSRSEVSLLETVFAHHELGTVPEVCVETLRALSTRHELRLLTNIWSPKDPWVEYLSALGVFELFSHAVFSSDTRSVKPSQRLLVAALDGVRHSHQEILMVGDSLDRDLQPARAAGLATLWVSNAAVPPRARHLVDYQVGSISELAATRSQTHVLPNEM